MLLVRETAGGVVATGCLGLRITLLLMIVVGVVTGMWVNAPIVDWAVAPLRRPRVARRGLGRDPRRPRPPSADRDRRRSSWPWPARAFFASFSFFAAFGESSAENGSVNLSLVPAAHRRLAAQLRSFSAIVSAWYLAAYAALAIGVDDRRKLRRAMSYRPFFSRDAHSFRPSAIRAFAKLINDPNIISFAGGVPNPETFPAERIAEVAEKVMRERRTVALQYGPTRGLPRLCECDRGDLPRRAGSSARRTT